MCNPRNDASMKLTEPTAVSQRGTDAYLGNQDLLTISHRVRLLGLQREELEQLSEDQQLQRSA